MGNIISSTKSLNRSIENMDENDYDCTSSSRNKNYYYYTCRKAYHAGSWYSNDPEQLRDTLETYIQDVHEQQVVVPTNVIDTKRTLLRAILCPHAGYNYSGPTAAYSYNALLQELLTRPYCQEQQQQQQQSKDDIAITQIIVLHPSHHVLLRGKCAISGARTIDTPLGSLHVDTTLREEILQLQSKYQQKQKQKQYQFTIMTQIQDEQEHSGEMQYPYIAYVLEKVKEMSGSNVNINKNNTITVTPIMCGSLTQEDEIAYGTILSEILRRPNVLTVISTDFCHWGSRFAYRPTTINAVSTSNNTNVTSSSVNDTSRTQIPIHEIIQQLDRRGMDLIEAQQPGAFASYLQETNNTICGRHAVAVWLRAVTTNESNQNNTNNDRLRSSTLIQHSSHHTNGEKPSNKGQDYTIQFIKYAQSSKVTSMSDSSVSYAAAIGTIAIE